MESMVHRNGQYTCSPWSAKNLINRNWLKKFMQVGVDVTCLYTNFGGDGLSCFGDIATFKNSQISLYDHELYIYSPWSLKNLINQNWLKKLMQVEVDVKCMHTNFDGHGCIGFRDIATFKNSQISLSDHGL